MFLKARAFSHVYVERGVAENPRTVSILRRFPSSSIVMVDDYQNVFGRGRQDFWKQKASPKLILAQKKDNFLYSGNDLLQGNQLSNFCYNAVVLNCPYDCHYCYLQGMYAGANLVAFVNLEDYFTATLDACRNRANKEEPLHLAISYDTDLLAMEGKLGYVQEWIEWVRHKPEILIEVRTKSTASGFLAATPPTRSARVAWTLSPGEISNRYEIGAPDLTKRIEAVTRAAEKGWRIGICIDPILQLPGSREQYAELVELLGRQLPWPAIERVELGVFRVGTSFFKRMQKRTDTDLLHYPYEHDTSAVSYKKKEREQLVDEVLQLLLEFTTREKIYTWT